MNGPSEYYAPPDDKKAMREDSISDWIAKNYSSGRFKVIIVDEDNGFEYNSGNALDEDVGICIERNMKERMIAELGFGE